MIGHICHTSRHAGSITLGAMVLCAFICTVEYFDAQIIGDYMVQVGHGWDSHPSQTLNVQKHNPKCTHDVDR